MGELSTIQLILIGVGALIALPNVIDLFKGFSVPVFGKSSPKVNTSTAVTQWQDLYYSCEKLCLLNACKKLDEVFPLLVDKDDDCLQKESQIENLNG